MRRQNFSELLETSKQVILQSADGRVTSNHCRVTVQWLFSKIPRIAWNVEKRLFDSRPTVAWPPTTVAWTFSDFFKVFPNCWKRRKKLFDSRPTVVWPLTTFVWPFSNFKKKFLTCLKGRKKLFDSRPTVAWPLITVAWPFSDFFQNFAIFAETSKESCLTVGRRSRDLRRLSRDSSATFFKIFQICL